MLERTRYTADDIVVQYKTALRNFKRGKTNQAVWVVSMGCNGGLNMILLITYYYMLNPEVRVPSRGYYYKVIKQYLEK